MWRNGAEIEVAECDDKVQNVYDYSGKFPNFVVREGQILLLFFNI